MGNNDIEMGIPALLISGPPKTGTNALLSQLSLYPDTFAYPKEHFFWAGGNHKNSRCEPKLSITEWTNFLNQYAENNATLSSLVPIINSSDPLCNKQRYQDTFQDILSLKSSEAQISKHGESKFGHRFDPKQCINPLNRYLYQNMAFQTIHQPIEAPPKNITAYDSIKPTMRRIYCDKMLYLDESIGKIVNTLKQNGLYENTLIAFSTDNGGMPYWLNQNTPFEQALSYGCNYPYRAGKATLFENMIM